MRICIFDTEVNSFRSKECIQLGAVVVDTASAGEIISSMEQLYMPVDPIDFESCSVHGITPDQIKGHPESFEARGDLRSFYKKNECHVLAAHNIEFDTDVIGIRIPEKSIDTLLVCQHLWPEESGKLGAVFLRMFGMTRENVEFLRGAHDALTDCRITARVLCQILEEITPDEAVEITRKAIENVVMPFGKHRGVPVAELPIDYARWLVREGSNLSSRLAAALIKRIK